ncbi:hypothetical protein SUDANB67_02577 [Nocardiopsis dassonvillei]
MTEAAPAVGLSRWNYLLGICRELDVPDGWRAEILDEDSIRLVAPPSMPPQRHRVPGEPVVVRHHPR